jgi:hypothetical protein
MSKQLGKRKVRLFIGTIAAAGVASVAFGYWTAGGSGSGSGAAAGAQSPLTANQTTTLSAMYPGDSPQTISGDFTNANSGPIRVATVTVSIASVTKAGGAPAGTCDASDFTLSGAGMAVGAEVPVGTHVGSFSGATIQFNDKATTNQDACKGATVNLAYAIA